MVELVEDLFGHLCRKYFDAGESAELKLELDNGVVMDDFPVSFYVDTAELRELERRFLERAKGRILDIGSGPGRVSLILKEKGFDVTGVDCSEHMVYIARERGLKVYEMDVNEELPPEKFDTFVMYGNGFGMPDSIANVKSLLARLRGIANPNALIIAESNDPNRMVNPIDLEYQKRNLERGEYIGHRRWRHVSGELTEEFHTWVQVEPKLLEEIASETGWALASKLAYEEGSQWGAYFFVLSKNL